MTAEQITTILTNLFTTGGVAIFFFYLFRGLRSQITSLNKTIDTQNKTLEVMEKRVLETEKVGNIYRDLIDDLPIQVAKYKKFLNDTKDDVIAQLERAQDAAVRESREIELKRLELQEQLISELPQLRDRIVILFQAIEERLSAVPDFVPVKSKVDQNKISTAIRNLGIVDAEYLYVDDLETIDRTASYMSLPAKPDDDTSTDSPTNE